MGLPGDDDRLELTYNFGVDSYELGTRLRPHRDHRRTTWTRRSSGSPAQGIAARAAAKYSGQRRRLVRPRFVRDPDDYRVELIERK